MIDTQIDLHASLTKIKGVVPYRSGFETDNWSVLPLVETIVRRRELEIASCLDIGAGDRPKSDWFRKNYKSKQRRFAALEVDENLRERLAKKNIQSESSFAVVPDQGYDMSLALEVMEHLRPSDSVPFLQQVARVTSKIYAMTAPNFEYWDENFRAKPRYKDIRWIPDHFVAWDPESSNPHKHKQMTTPELISGYFAEAFPSDEWETAVFRAWPWDLKDRTREFKAKYFFKVFGIAIRRDA